MNLILLSFTTLLVSSIFWYYVVFSIFVYYVQLNARDFRGGSKIYELVLSLLGFIGMITGYIYLIAIGFCTMWYYPVVIWGGTFVLTSALVFPFELLFERKTGVPLKIVLGFCGIGIVPLFGFMMIRLLCLW